MTDVSIVLLNWNSGATVFDAAESALAQQGVTVELIIADNGSTDGSLEELKRRFSAPRFIEIGYNSGFTGGMNAGTQAALGEHVLWQNADLVLAPDYCLQGVKAFRTHQEVGAVGGLVQRLTSGERTQVRDSAGYYLSMNHRARLVPNDIEQNVLGVSGSCPLFRRAALEDIRAPLGYVLDPWYFTYFEDIDVMLRLSLAGWRVRYVPAMRAWHVRSASTVPDSRFYEKPDHTQVHHFKNRIATIIKTTPWRALVRRLPALLSTELAIPVFFLLLRRPRSLRNWARGWISVWKERTRLLRDRAALDSRSSPRTRAELTRLLAQRP
jgi:GT2 family glycosyltransferase